ncbi:MAG: IS4 family transposase [Acidobacteriota bacterium]
MRESSTNISLIVKALEKEGLQEVFDKDPYESRRDELKGSRLVNLMVIYQLIKSRFMRGLVRAIKDNESLQKASGGEIALNTVSNALGQRSLAQMMEAWQLVISSYGARIERVGKRFVRIALIDSSLIKLSLAAYDWAEYHKAKRAAKIHMVLDWGRRIPEQLTITTGRLNDLNKAVKVVWQRGWTYVQDRGYLCFTRLKSILAAGAHFVVRVKHNTDFQVVERRAVDTHLKENGIRLRSDWTIRLVRWSDTLLRLVSYQLPDGTLIRVFTDRFDLTAANVAQLYKQRWQIENWWKWIKAVFKIKEPIARNENGLQVQIITALIADLLFRVFKKVGNFPSTLYEFVVRCQEMSLVPWSNLANGSLRRALELIYFHLSTFNSIDQATRAA